MSAKTAPRLRQAIGKQVEIPWTSVVLVDGREIKFGGRTTLTYVGYRRNDKWGFFDLVIRYQGDSSGMRGLSPSEAAAIMVLDP